MPPDKPDSNRSPIRDLPFDGLVMATLDSLGELGADGDKQASFFASVFGIRRALLTWRDQGVQPQVVLADAASQNPTWPKVRLTAERLLGHWNAPNVQRAVWSSENPLAATGAYLGSVVDRLSSDRSFRASFGAGIGVAFAMVLVRSHKALAERLLESC